MMPRAGQPGGTCGPAGWLAARVTACAKPLALRQGESVRVRASVSVCARVRVCWSVGACASAAGAIGCVSRPGSSRERCARAGLLTDDVLRTTRERLCTAANDVKLAGEGQGRGECVCHVQ